MAVTTVMISATTYCQGDCLDNCLDNCQDACAPTTSCYDSCCGHFILEAEVLYWRAFEGGLSNPCDEIEINTVGDTSILDGRNHDPDPKWDLGFRVGIGYEFVNNCDLTVYWTRYDSQTDGGDDSTRHKWKIDLDVIDALYRCDCNWFSCFAFNPYLGVRYAKIDQSLRKNRITTIDDGDPEISRARIKERFWGVGPLFGVEGDVGLRCGFSLYGNVAVGVLYGHYDVNSRKVTVLDSGITNFDRIENDTHAFPIVLDLGVGVRWSTCFCNDKLFMMQLGLEEHRYFNHNQFCGYGDLSLAGLNFGIGIEY